MHIKEKLISVMFIFLCFMFVGCKRTSENFADIMNREVKLDFGKMEDITSSRSCVRDDSVYSGRFVVYYDSTLCASCQMSRWGIWNMFTNDVSSKIKYTFILHPLKEQIKSIKERYTLMNMDFNVYIDTLGIFEQDNDYVVVCKGARAFLLNSDRCIIFVGNPTENLKNQQRYSLVVDSIKQSLK